MVLDLMMSCTTAYSAVRIRILAHYLPESRSMWIHPFIEYLVKRFINLNLFICLELNSELQFKSPIRKRDLFIYRWIRRKNHDHLLSKKR